MKISSLVLSVALLSAFLGFSTSASAYWHGGGWHGGYGHWHRGCSPEVTKTSTTVVQKVLADAAANPSFAATSTFQDFVATTGSMTDSSAKLHAYLGAVGVDSNDADAIAQFMGARDHSNYVSAAEKNLGLTQAQADVLVQNVTGALLNMTTGSN